MAGDTRESLLHLTPDVYLRGGFRRDGGDVRDLTGRFASAAAVQMEEAEVSPQELSFTFEALRELLPIHDGDPPTRLRSALGESFQTVREMIHQQNNPGLVEWLNACAAHVDSTNDIDDFMAHFQGTLRQYAVFQALRRAPSRL